MVTEQRSWVERRLALLEDSVEKLEGRFPKNARYSTLQGHVHPGVTVTTHGSIPGLGNDDHLQYVYHAGRTSGQRVIGGTGASENLILESTSHATKGQVRIEPRAQKLVFGFTSSPNAQDIRAYYHASTTRRLVLESDTTPPSIALLAAGDTQSRVLISQGTVGFQLGPGGATAPDTKFYRRGAGHWKMENVLVLPEITAPTFTPSGLTNEVAIYVKDFAGQAVAYLENDAGFIRGPLGSLPGIFGRGSTAMGGYCVNNGAAAGGLTGVDGWGTLGTPSLSGSATTTFPWSTTLYPCLVISTSATINTPAGLEWDVFLLLGRDPFLNFNASLGTLTSVRMFVGYSNQTLATMVGADNPAGHYIGLQFSTARGDTNWQFVAKNGTTQTLVDTGAAITTGVRGFLMTYDHDVGMEMSLFAANDPQESVVPTFVTTIALADGPDSVSTQLRRIIGVQNLAASVRTINTSFGYESCNG